MKLARRVFALLTLGVLYWLLRPLLDELRAAGELFRAAQWGWLPLVLATALASYAALTWLNQLALAPFPGRIPFRRLAAVLTAMAYIEVTVPSAGASGLAMRARLLGRHGYSLAASSFSFFVEIVALAAVTALLGSVGAIHLYAGGAIGRAQTAGLAGLVLTLTALAVGLWLIIIDRERSRRCLVAVAPYWNRLVGRWRRLDPERIENRLEHFHAGLAEFRRTPKTLFALAAGLRVGLDLATLGGCFLLFGCPLSFGALLTGYAVLLVASMLAALPGGLALPDAAVPLVFQQLGVSAAGALAAGLTYRLIAVWLVRLIGFVSWQVLEERT